jgi:hypothetical protein
MVEKVSLAASVAGSYGVFGRGSAPRFSVLSVRKAEKRLKISVLY